MQSNLKGEFYIKNVKIINFMQNLGNFFYIKPFFEKKVVHNNLIF